MDDAWQIPPPEERADFPLFQFRLIFACLCNGNLVNVSCVRTLISSGHMISHVRVTLITRRFVTSSHHNPW